MILGIDCSTNPSGGGKRHIIELFNNFEPGTHEVHLIKIWGKKSFLNIFPDYPWLLKYTHPLLEKNILFNIFWKIFYRETEFNNQFDILYLPFGTYIGNFRPYVSMSQNMLLFDKKERDRFKFSFIWIKLILLSIIQRLSFKNSSGIIFISKYAKNTISDLINIKNITSIIIHHGVSNKFKYKPRIQDSINNYNKNTPYKLLFLSSIWVYKHPIILLDAVEILIIKGYPIELHIVGDNAQKYIGTMLEIKLNIFNKKYGKIVYWHKFVGLDEVQDYYFKSDMFIFTSTCENMPNILIEAMASGLPICCSNYLPMPEFLEDGGMYFDPLDSSDIANKIEELLLNLELRISLSERAYILSNKYTWKKCANETFKFLSSIVNQSHV
jgi:glycosyltransferase involved in cell wall biosynthesis